MLFDRNIEVGRSLEGLLLEILLYTLAIKVTLLRQDFKCHYLLCIYMYRKQSNYMFSDIITQKKTKRFNILWKQRQSIM